MLNKEINKYIGIKWLDCGRDIKHGFDCWGFFKYFYKNHLGIVVKDFEENSSDMKALINVFRTEQEDKETWNKIKTPYDYVAVAMGRNVTIHHVGIFYNDGVLHCTRGFGVVYNTFTQLKRNGYNLFKYYEYKK